MFIKAFLWRCGSSLKLSSFLETHPNWYAVCSAFFHLHQSLVPVHMQQLFLNQSSPAAKGKKNNMWCRYPLDWRQTTCLNNEFKLKCVTVKSTTSENSRSGIMCTLIIKTVVNMCGRHNFHYSNKHWSPSKSHYSMYNVCEGLILLELKSLLVCLRIQYMERFGQRPCPQFDWRASPDHWLHWSRSPDLQTAVCTLYHACN